MIEPVIIITNNPMVVDNLTQKARVVFIEDNTLEVLKTVRNYVHMNHRLLTHPLVSSIKPNEIPYKTVVISKKKESYTELQSLDLIENSIAATQKFLKDFGIPNWSEKILLDFQLIDYDIISNALN